MLNNQIWWHIVNFFKKNTIGGTIDVVVKGGVETAIELFVRLQ